jgi:hypothetical protein
MILIIDVFNVPSKKVVGLLKIKGRETVLTKEVFIAELDCLSKDVYTLHKEESEEILRHVKYYFNEIYEVVDDLLVYINKKRRIIKRYDIIRLHNGCVTGFKEILSKNRPSVESPIKKDYLPFIKAQDGETVRFPDDEEED